MDSLAGGLHAQMVCQVKGLDGVIKGRRTITGGTSGVGQGVRVNGGDWAILIVDVGGELGILGPLPRVRAFLPPWWQ